MDLQTFKKSKDFLICVDSDGCAMDTMDIKHKKCFGPCLVAEWGLEQWKDSVLARWNEINLYTQTRGINRYRGLLMMLEEVNATIKPIEGLQVFKNWVNSTQEFSNASLQREIDKNDNICLRKAISWSNNLNNAIEGLTDDEKKPFAGVKQTLESCHKLANIAIVSSANGGAVRDEWYKYGLAEHVDVILTQEMGDKAYCISAMQSKGYCKDKVLMVGDAVGDLKAAESSGVLFYPILVGKEEASWQNLLNEAVPKLVNGSFDKTYQKQLIERLYSNFHKN